MSNRYYITEKEVRQALESGLDFNAILSIAYYIQERNRGQVSKFVCAWVVVLGDDASQH
jgi:hypothetical protein